MQLSTEEEEAQSSLTLEQAQLRLLELTRSLGRREVFDASLYGEAIVALVRVQYLTQDLPLPDEYWLVVLPKEYLDAQIFQASTAITSIDEINRIGLAFYVEPASPMGVSDLKESVYMAVSPISLGQIHTLLIGTQPLLGPLAHTLDLLIDLGALGFTSSYNRLVEDGLKSSSRALERLRNSVELRIPCVTECSGLEDLRFFYPKLMPLPLKALKRLKDNWAKYVPEGAKELQLLLEDESKYLMRLVSKEVESYIERKQITGTEDWIGKLGSQSLWYNLGIKLGIPNLQNAWKRGRLHENTYLIGACISGGPNMIYLGEDKTIRRALALMEDEIGIDMCLLEQWSGVIYFRIEFSNGEIVQGTMRIEPVYLDLVVETKDTSEFQAALDRIETTLSLVQAQSTRTNMGDAVILSFHPAIAKYRVRMGTRYDSVRSCYPSERGYIGSQGIFATATSRLDGLHGTELLYPEQRLLEGLVNEDLSEVNLSPEDQEKFLSRLNHRPIYALDLLEEIGTRLSGVSARSVYQAVSNKGYSYTEGQSEVYQLTQEPKWYRGMQIE